MTFDEILYYLPDEILALVTECAITPQNPQYHPEAPNAKVPHNVYAHIGIVYDRAVETGNIDLVMAALFHDLGKPETTFRNAKGKWSSYGHEFISAKLVDKHSDWIERKGAHPDVVVNIVKEHMRAKRMNDMRASKRKELEENPFYEDIMKFTKLDDMSTLTEEEMNKYDTIGLLK